jgi:stage II sporulation protein D
MDDYVKGILPYEMSPSWPLEALKAQAVCARTYTLSATGSKHQNQHFDICNTTCCQVYRGLNNASDATNQAVDETSGVYAWYNGNLAQTFYYASNGGASEDVRNVWNGSTSLPYLSGVVDPYETGMESTIPGYHWSVSFTSDKLTSLLQSKGYACDTIVELKVTQYTSMGNVFSIAFIDSSGTSFPFSRERARTILGLKSMRFQISGSASDAMYYVDDNGKTLSDMSGIWSIGENGTTSQLSESTGLYVITSSSTDPLHSSSVSGSGLFTVTGTGNGHNVGMSQWGAYAMAKQGFTYDQILKFYYTGIDLN